MSGYARSSLNGGAVIGRLRTVVLVSCFAFFGLATPADATFPGANGKIAFHGDNPITPASEIYAIDADGSASTNLTNTLRDAEQAPSWSPDGTKIAL